MRNSMRSMRIMALAALLILVTGSLFADGQTKIKIGYFKLEPHIMDAEGKLPVGATVDLWNDYLAKELDAVIQWAGPIPMLRLLKMLELGEIDAIALLAKNDERAAMFLYPKVEYTTMQPGMAVLKTSGVTKITTPSELYGKTIGYFSGGFLSPFMTDKKLTIGYIASADWLETNYKMLKVGRIFAFYETELVTIKYQFKALGDYDLFNFIELPDSPTLIYSVFSKSNAALMASYEAALSKVLKTVSYAKLLEKYLISE